MGGRPRVDDKIILHALLYRLRQSCTWRALNMFAPFTTIYGRWKEWCESGVWDRILAHFAGDASGLLWAIDSSCAKVHKHAFGGTGGPEKQGIGQTRGGANSKIHALVDAKARPVRLLLSPGNRSDIIYAPDLVEDVYDRTILADKAYDSDEFRALLAAFGLGCCIPPKSNRVDPPPYNRIQYKKRHRVENCFQRLKEYRAIAMRLEKLGSRYMGFVTLVSILIWLG